MLLTLLAILVAGLLALVVVKDVVPEFAMTASIAAIGAVVVVLAAMAPAVSPGATTLDLPIGPLGATVHLTLDPLAASFLLLLFLVMPCAETAPLPLAATALTVLAGDSFTVAVGLLLLGGVSALRVTVAAAVCLTVAFALAGPLGDFAALRAAPPDGWRAALVLLLVLVGAGVLGRVSLAVAAYLVLRVLFDLCGAGQPPWWGVPLLLAGAAIAVVGSLRAAVAGTLHEALSAAPLHAFGMAAMALGVALVARAVDLPLVAAQALDAAWLALVIHVLCRTLLLRAAQAVEAGAGTRRLDRLGGLIHRMPVTAACCLVGVFALAVLPPSPGFASFWLLFQSLLAAARIGALGLQVLVVCVAAVAAFSAGLIVLAGVRLFGVVFLGRPRTPRTAVADEASRPVQLVLGGLAGLVALLGLLPALALLPASGWIPASGLLSFIVLRTGAETPGYSPIAIAALLAAVGVAVARALRRSGQERREPAWSGGFAAPSWLPFGDPATQFGPVSFSEPLGRIRVLPASIDPIRRYLGRCHDAVVRATKRVMAP